MFSIVIAAALSLSNAADYVYTTLPTNANLLGVGAGSAGDCRIPRREDWEFLLEAQGERISLAEWLCAVDPATNALPRPTGYPWNSAVPFLLPNQLYQGAQFYNGIVGEFGSDNYTSTACRFDAALISSRAACSNGLSYVHGSVMSCSNAWARMWQANEPQRSNRASDAFEQDGTNGLRRPLLSMDVLTNAYFDVEYNDAMCFAQLTRDAEGFSVSNEVADVCGSWPTAFRNGSFVYATNTITRSGGSYAAPWSRLLVHYKREVDANRGAFVGKGESGAVRTSGTWVEASSQNVEPIRAYFTFPVPRGGDEILEIKAFALVSASHSLSLKEWLVPSTNLVSDVYYYVWPLADPAYSGNDPDGRPVYEVTLPSMRSASQTLEAELGISMNPNETLGIVPTPPDPVEPTVAGRMAQTYSYATHTFDVQVDAVIGIAKMRFHACLAGRSRREGRKDAPAFDRKSEYGG